jgi:hypothetical protein
MPQGQRGTAAQARSRKSWGSGSVVLYTAKTHVTGGRECEDIHSALAHQNGPPFDGALSALPIGVDLSESSFDTQASDGLRPRPSVSSSQRCPLLSHVREHLASLAERLFLRLEFSTREASVLREMNDVKPSTEPGSPGFDPISQDIVGRRRCRAVVECPDCAAEVNVGRSIDRHCVNSLIPSMTTVAQNSR